MHITLANCSLVTQRLILLGTFFLLPTTGKLQASVAPPVLTADCQEKAVISGVETKLFTFGAMPQSGSSTTDSPLHFLLIGKQAYMPDLTKKFAVKVTLTKVVGTTLYDFKFKPGNDPEVNAANTPTGVEGEVMVNLGKSIVVTGKYKPENAADSAAKDYTATIHVASFRVHMNNTPTNRSNSNAAAEVDDVVFSGKDKETLTINSELKGGTSKVNVVGVTDIMALRRQRMTIFS